MKINKLTLTNFKSYFSSNVFDFSVTNEKNVIVIYADNGFGKTSIVQAINWVLYGDSYLEELIYKKKEKDIHLILKGWINESHLTEIIATGNTGELKVEMQFEDNGITFNITNKITFKATSKDDIEIITNLHNLKKLQEGGNWTNSPNLKIDINRILPVNIKNYFFFDAEKQSNLTMPNNQSKVEEAIFNIVGLQALQNSIENLTEVSKEYGRELGKYNLGNYTIKQKEKIALDEKISADESTLTEHKNQRIKLKSYIENIEKELRELPDTSTIQGKIDNLKERKSDLVLNKFKTEKDLSKLCYKSLPIILESNLNDFNNDLLRLKNEGKIPGSISLLLLNEILESKTCICGTKINETTTHSKECNKVITKLLIEVGEQSDNKQKLLDIYSKTTNLKSQLEDFKKESLNNLIDSLDRTNQLIEGIKEQIKELEEELGGIDDKSIKEKKDQKDKFTKELEELIQTIGGIISQLAIDKEARDKLIAELEEMDIKDEEAKKLKRYEKIARDSAASLLEIFTNFTEESRKEISEQTALQWNKLIKSTKTLKVEVDSTYALNVKNNLGQNAINDLAEGQKQGLVLAFVAAISNVSQKYPPYIIDMPFGRLGEESQREVAQFLPKACQQLILLLNKSSEWNELTKEYLTPKCNKIIELVFDEDQRKTTLN